MTQTRRQRRAGAQTHTHEVRQAGNQFIVAGGVLAIVIVTIMISAFYAYLVDRRAVTEDARERTDREIADLTNAVCDALAVTIMGSTDPAALERADRAGAQLGCEPPPSQRQVDGYPIQPPAPSTPPAEAPEGAGQPRGSEDTGRTDSAAPGPVSEAPATGSDPTPAPPATVDPQPVPAPTTGAPAPQPSPSEPPALLEPVVDGVCDLLGVCLGD